MDIIILADFCGNFEGTGNNRFIYLARLLSENHNVEVVTSDFWHGEKKHFEINSQPRPYKVTLLHEPGYPKNICLRRFYSHFVWGKNVKKYLAKRKKPDVIYCAIPTLQAPYEAAKYCKKNNIKFIIDIQDLWPEAFQMVFRIPVISGLIFSPFRWLANGIYKRADEVCAVSKSYVKRALSVNRQKAEGHAVFLGTRLSTYDDNIRNNIDSILDEVGMLPKESGELWIGYCGSLGDSYDIKCVINALKILKDRGVYTPKFVVMGDGYKKREFMEHATAQQVDAVFTGRLPYEKMCALLSLCDITVNPIVGGSAASIINKHADYAASGRAVVNSQESKEYRDLIDEYGMGLNCESEDADDMAKQFERLITDEQLRLEMGRNARRCAEERFDRKQSYSVLVSCIEGNG